MPWFPWRESPAQRRLREERERTELESLQTRTARNQLSARKTQFTLDLAEACVRHSHDTGDPSGMAMAIELVTGNPIKPRNRGYGPPVPQGDQLGSALLPLFLELLKSRMDSDPIAVWERMQKIEDRALEREEKRAKRETSPDGVPPLLNALMHSPMGEQLGATAGPLLVSVAQTMAQRPGHPGAALGPSQPHPTAHVQEVPRGAGAAAPGPLPDGAAPPTSPSTLPTRPTPEAVLAVLETRDPPAIARQLVAWAQAGDEEMARTVQGFATLDDAQIVAQLEPARGAMARLSPWSKVATWLLDHPTERQAILVEVKQVFASQPVPSQPVPSQPDGSRHNGAPETGSRLAPGPEKAQANGAVSTGIGY